MYAARENELKAKTTRRQQKEGERENEGVQEEARDRQKDESDI